MRFREILDYLCTFDGQAVEKRSFLRGLCAEVNRQHPRQFKFSFSPFSFGEIDDEPVGERLTIRERRFLGKKLIELDIPYSPQKADRCCLVVNREGYFLGELVREYLSERNISFNY